MTQENSNILENSDYKNFEEKRWKGREQQLVFRHKIAYELLIKSNSNSFLDIGCGDGVFEEFIENKNKNIKSTGIDFSSTAVESAKERNLNADFIMADVTSGGVPFDDNSFDTVIALDVLEHQFAPQDLLKEMKRVAKKFVIVGVPNFSSFPSRIQMLCGRVPENNRPKKGHVYWFNREKLINLLENGGFKIVVIRMNYQLERYFLIGAFLRFLTKIFPGLFALSFVVLAEKEV